METCTADTLWSDLFPPSVPDESGFEIRPLSVARQQVRVWGRFLPGWLSGFTAGLADQKIGIVRGAAKKTSPSIWFAGFEIDAPAESAARIDYLALTQKRAAPRAPTAIRLEGFHMDLEEENGALYVEVRGEDQVGFLDALLRRFALFSLFPAELVVETVGGRVFDRLWLKGIGGLSPSAATIGTLRSELKALCAP